MIFSVYGLSDIEDVKIKVQAKPAEDCRFPFHDCGRGLACTTRAAAGRPAALLSCGGADSGGGADADVAGGHFGPRNRVDGMDEDVAESGRGRAGGNPTAGRDPGYGGPGTGSGQRSDGMSDIGVLPASRGC